MFRNLKLGPQILGGFSLVLLLLVMVAVVGYNSLSQVVNRVIIADGVTQLEKKILEARQHEKNYIITPSAESLKLVNKTTGDLKSQAASLQTRLTETDTRALMDDVQARTGAYEKAFKGYVDLEHQRSQTMEKMTARADMTLEKIESLLDSQAYQLKEIREKNRAYIAAKLQKAGEANALLMQSMEARVLQESVAQNYYRSVFMDWDQLSGQLLKKAGTLKDSFKEKENIDRAQTVIETWTAYINAFRAWEKDKSSENLYKVNTAGKHSRRMMDYMREDQAEQLEFAVDDTNEMMNDMLAKTGEANQIIRWFKFAREIEKEAIIQRDPALFSQVGEQLDKILAKLADLRERFTVEADQWLCDQAKTAVKQYQSAYLEYQTLMEQQKVALDQMIGAAGQVEKLCEQIRVDQKNLMYARISTSNQVTLIGTAAAIVIGLLLAIFIARGITRSLKEVIHGINDGSDQMVSAATQVSSSSQSLAEGASEQAASIEETSANLEQMSTMANLNADNARKADELMNDTGKEVERASGAMSDLHVSINDIAQASEETQKIIKTIDEIAFQTNLLALNAAVEAARAGESGAGFAVVADEVRNLAMRSADAARNTADLIEGTVSKVNVGKDLVGKAGGVFENVSASTYKVVDIVSEITTSSGRQAQSIEEVNSAVIEMDKVVQSNAAGAEESASASEEMSAQAEQLKSLVKNLAALAGDVDGAVPKKLPGPDTPPPAKVPLRDRFDSLRKRLVPRLLTFKRKSAQPEETETQF